MTLECFDRNIEKILTDKYLEKFPQRRRWELHNFKRGYVLTYVESDYYSLDLLENLSLKEEIDDLINYWFSLHFSNSLVKGHFCTHKTITFKFFIENLSYFKNKVYLPNEKFLTDLIKKVSVNNRTYDFVKEKSFISDVIKFLNIRFKN